MAVLPVPVARTAIVSRTSTASAASRWPGRRVSTWASSRAASPTTSRSSSRAGLSIGTRAVYPSLQASIRERPSPASRRGCRLADDRLAEDRGQRYVDGEQALVPGEGVAAEPGPQESDHPAVLGMDVEVDADSAGAGSGPGGGIDEGAPDPPALRLVGDHDTEVGDATRIDAPAGVADGALGAGSGPLEGEPGAAVLRVPKEGADEGGLGSPQPGHEPVEGAGGREPGEERRQQGLVLCSPGGAEPGLGLHHGLSLPHTS